MLPNSGEFGYSVGVSAAIVGGLGEAARLRLARSSLPVRAAAQVPQLAISVTERSRFWGMVVSQIDAERDAARWRFCVLMAQRMSGSRGGVHGKRLDFTEVLAIWGGVGLR